MLHTAQKRHRLDPCEAGMGKLNLTVSGRDLPRKDWFSKSDPFLCVLLATRGQYQLVTKTETVMNNHNPNWETIEITNPDIHEHNKGLKIQLQVLDYDGPGKADDMCNAFFSIATLEEAAKTNQKLILYNRKHKEDGYLIIKYFHLSSDLY